MSSTRTRRRTVVAMLALLALVSVFVVRLVDIQVVRADDLNAAAFAKRSTTDPILGSRGQIVDSKGEVLAESVLRYDVAISPKNAMKAGGYSRGSGSDLVTFTLEEAEQQLGAAVGKSQADIHKIITDALAEDPESDFAYVAKQIDYTAFKAVDDLDIPWENAYRHPSRIYPDGAVAGNLVGYISDEGEAQAGLEAAQNACLASEDGETTYQQGVDGVEIPGTTTEQKDAKNGGTLGLTIDADLQWYVQQVLARQAQAVGAKWGTVVVQEVKTGKLLAVADYPTVDPNNIDATDPDYRGSQAFTAPFEPGSTFKALTAASAIDAGKADPLTQVVAPYRIKFPNGADINDSDRHDDENLTLTGVLIESSNTGMSQIGERMSDQQRYDYMKAFGLGSSSEAGFYAEDPGDIHDSWEDWDPQTKYATMFGQGLTVTAVQMSSIYQTIANGGVRMPVQLITGCTHEDGTVTGAPSEKGRQVVSPQAAAETSQMLENVYANSWVNRLWNIPGYRVAAKTGTAQMSDGHGGYSHGYLVSVAGFAPADDPQFVVSVSLADAVNNNTSAASAPIFRDVMSQVLKTYRAVPSGAPAPQLPATW